MLQRLIIIWSLFAFAIPTTYAQQIEQDHLDEIIRRLWATPIFSNMTTDQVYEIFELGITRDAQPNIFTTVGDSNTANGDFMRPLGLPNNNCDLGDYPELQETVDYFAEVSPRDKQANSFTNDSVAADVGFGTPTVLNPAWADWWLCERNETPLLCEYRISRASVSVIMLGQIDINDMELSPESYRANMERIITDTIDAGVIPVMTTIVFLPQRVQWWETSMLYNEAILDIAEEHQVPLINLWAAAQELPNYGIGPDKSHLSARVGKFCSFDGAENEYGGTLRNLLTLQALDELRREVLDPQPTTP